MEMKRCDKKGCGKIYKLNEHASGSIQIKVHDGSHISWNNPYVLDYCPKCMKEMEKLILPDS